MSRFIESIFICNQKARHLELHQNRMDNSLISLGHLNRHCLKKMFLGLDIPDNGVYKWRLLYDEKQVHSNELIPYAIQCLSDLELCDVKDFQYPYKWENRDFFKEQKAKSSASELIYFRNNFVLESSYANLLFYGKSGVFTPKTILLNGIQRQHLIQNKRIVEKKISLAELNQYSHIQLINAMLDMDNSPKYPITNIRKKINDR